MSRLSRPRDAGLTMSLVSSDDRMPPELGLSDAEPENWVEALSIPGPGQDPP